jgi:hypothetical protein
MNSAAVLDDVEILSNVLSAGTPDFDADAARAVLRLGFSDEQKALMIELVDKGNRGLLSAAEQDRMDRFRRVGNFLALMQSKARLSLKHAENDPRHE